jgi:ankyrin repeat protein
LEAVKNDDTATLQTLLNGGMPPNVQNCDPVYWAVYFNHEEILKLLLAHGAKVDRRFPPENVSPMELARKSHPELLPILQAAAQKSAPKSETSTQPSDVPSADEAV